MAVFVRFLYIHIQSLIIIGEGVLDYNIICNTVLSMTYIMLMMLSVYAVDIELIMGINRITPSTFC